MPGLKIATWLVVRPSYSGRRGGETRACTRSVWRSMPYPRRGYRLEKMQKKQETVSDVCT